MRKIAADSGQNKHADNQESIAVESQAIFQASTKKSSSNPRLIFALIIAASFLDIIDFSIVQVALPTIRGQFAVSLADSQWIIGAYGITLAGFLMLSGRAGDIYGQKKIFISGILIFTLASFAGGDSGRMMMPLGCCTMS